MGQIERYSAALDELMLEEAEVEVLARGFLWSEGPVWDSANRRLIFTDVPANTAYAWTEEAGVSLFLRPSGHTSVDPDSTSRQGANGLAFSPDGQLVLCQHGDRRVALYSERDHTFATIAKRSAERRFLSPNDLVYDSRGNLFFTDPPYGHPREVSEALDRHYIYRIDPDGSVTTLADSIWYPNGIGLSPDERTLYVTSSYYKDPALYAFSLDSSGTPQGEARLLLHARPFLGEGRKGACDGLAVDKLGNVWLTGPGGVYILSPMGELLGFVNIEGQLANCAFGGPDGTTLYLTAHDKLLRIQTKVTGIVGES